MQDYYRVSKVLCRWIRLGQLGDSIEKLLINRGYRNIAIYGFTDIGGCMVYELDNSQLNVKFIIDQQGSKLQVDMESYTLEEAPIDGIDVVICCYIDNGDTVKGLKRHFSCDVLTVEELVYEL